MQGAKLLREQAERCYRLARAFQRDSEIALQLAMLGDEYRQCADKAEAEEAE